MTAPQGTFLNICQSRSAFILTIAVNYFCYPQSCINNYKPESDVLVLRLQRHPASPWQPQVDLVPVEAMARIILVIPNDALLLASAAL